MVNFSEIIRKESEQLNIHDHLKKFSLKEIKELHSCDRKPYAVALLNITGDLNIGSIIRSASLLGAREVVLFGRRKYDRRSTVGAEQYISVYKIAALDDNLNIDYIKIYKYFNDHNYQPIFFETGGRSINKKDWRTFISAIYFGHNGRIPIFVFGSEGNGIDQSFIDLYGDEYKFTIPQLGVIRSFNVSVAASIAMYHISNEMGWI